jgi:hypothetical protein
VTIRRVQNLSMLLARDVVTVRDKWRKWAMSAYRIGKHQS